MKGEEHIGSAPAAAKPLDLVLEEAERHYIREILDENSGNITAAASTLGLSRQGLYKKMKRLGIDWHSQF